MTTYRIAAAAIVGAAMVPSLGVRANVVFLAVVVVVLASLVIERSRTVLGPAR